jgi:hypothetical protein
MCARYSYTTSMTVTCESHELLLQYWPRPRIGIGHFMQRGSIRSQECVRKQYYRLEYVLWLTASTSPVRSTEGKINNRRQGSSYADKCLLNTVTTGHHAAEKFGVLALVGDSRKRTMDTWRGDAVSRSANYVKCCERTQLFQSDQAASKKG